MGMLPRNLDLWLPGLLAHRLRGRPAVNGPVHVYFALVDHYEPSWHRADPVVQRTRVDAWVKRYPEIAARHRDSEGRSPRHTFFFPEDEYVAEHLDRLAELCRQGWGDVDVHLHHDRDTPDGFREKMLRYCELLDQRHGLLRRDETGRLVYGFIHGNFALNNSRPDGRWCGVDDETSILMETGCYADFTMPSAPEATQARRVNSIYYAIPRKTRRAHDTGPEAAAGRGPRDGLLMITGPLGLNWHSRKSGLLPRLDNGEVAWHNPPTAARVALWIGRHIHVRGAPEHVFVKVSTHGAQDKNVRCLLEGGLDQLWGWLESFCRPGGPYRLHYVTAYEMFRAIRRLETGEAPPAG